MSRILLIPVAVVFAASGVLLAPGEQAPASESQGVVTPSSQMVIQATNR